MGDVVGHTADRETREARSFKVSDVSNDRAMNRHVRDR
jgi:hypothetical protein